MIKVTGKLKTKVIHGRNGDFTIATLITEIGEFSVKDPTLDQYPEGIYDGEFTIQRIFPYSYSWGGNIKVEIRAMLDSMVIDEIDERVIPEEQEPDPINDRPTEIKTETILPADNMDVKTEPKSKPIKVETEEHTASTAQEELPKQVKLDPTVDRKQFRAECNRLKKLGYQFDPKTQLWNKP